MQTVCIRHGQIEVGVIQHEGREWSAFGATVQGHSIEDDEGNRAATTILLPSQY